MLLKNELLAQYAQALEALLTQNSKLHTHTVLALRRALSHGCVSWLPSFACPTAPMHLHPHLHLETALLQHSERILSRTQQDTLLLACPGHSECWQAHARRKSLALDAGLVLAAVADGVSLSPQSAFASRSFLQALHAQADLGGEAAHSSLALAHLVRHTHRLWQQQCLRPGTRGASTTLAALLVQQRRLSVVNVGDSRVWRLRTAGGALQCLQLSHDHTLWQQMLDAGEVDADSGEEPASFYQDLTHCLTLGDLRDGAAHEDSAGVEADFSDSERGSETGSDSSSAAVHDRDWLHLWQGELVPGDAFLLATDGLHGCVPGFALLDHWRAKQPLLENLKRLYAAWNASGGGDDISLVALHFTEK